LSLPLATSSRICPAISSKARCGVIGAKPRAEAGVSFITRAPGVKVAVILMSRPRGRPRRTRPLPGGRGRQPGNPPPRLHAAGASVQRASRLEREGYGRQQLVADLYNHRAILFAFRQGLDPVRVAAECDPGRLALLVRVPLEDVLD